MNRHYHLPAIICAILFFTLNVTAQNTRSTTTGATTASQTSTGTTSTNTGGTKIDQKVNQANGTVNNTTNAAQELKKKFDSLFKKHEPKEDNEVVIIIPGIEYEDENLSTLLSAIKDQKKDVKSASKEYSDGVATIQVELKNKGTADFWDELPKELSQLFKMKSKKGNSIIIDYKNAKPELVTGSSTTTTDNNTNTNTNSTGSGTASSNR